MDQVEHLYQAMFEFHTGQCGIEKVMKIMEDAGYDTAQGNLLHQVLDLLNATRLTQCTRPNSILHRYIKTLQLAFIGNIFMMRVLRAQKLSWQFVTMTKFGPIVGSRNGF